MRSGIRRHALPTRIVTDSTAQLTAGWAEEHLVTVLPQRIHMSGRTYAEGVDLDDEQFAALVADLPAEQWPAVEPPSVDDFAEVYQQLLFDTSDIISIHPSDRLTRAAHHARRAADVYRGRANITVLDSQTIGLGLNVLVRAVSDFASEGYVLDDIVKLARGIIPHIYGAFVTQDLQHMARSGTLRPAQAALGDLLGVIPFLSIEEGEIAAIEKVRSSERALEKLVEFAAEFDEPQELAILQLSARPNDQTLALVELLKGAFPALDDIAIRPCGATVGSIIGSTGIGIMIYEVAR
jgi:DegV family protein with EDD domain